MEQPGSNAAGNTEQNQQDVISDYVEGYHQLELQSAETQLKKTRNAIYVVAALILAGNLIIMAISGTFTMLGVIIVLVMAGVFAGLSLFTKKQPLTAVIIALILYAGLWIFDIIQLGPEMIYKGIVVKGIILYYLITGIKHAREAERLRREINVS